MKVTVSNIAWQATHDAEMYAFLKEKNVQVLKLRLQG